MLRKAGKATMTVNRLRTLCVEIFKTLNEINPSYMSKIFDFSESTRSLREQYTLNLKVHRHNQVNFGERSLKTLGPKVWNSLPYHIKASENLITFKKLIKEWDGITCKCNLCKNIPH